MHRNLLAQRTMRQGRPPDRTPVPLSSFDRAPAVRRYLDRSFDPCAFAGFQKPSTFRRTIPHRFQPTDKASTLPRHPAGDASCNRPHRVEPRRRRWSSSARWNKRSGIRARATLLRMHELAQIQIPVVTDRCWTPASWAQRNGEALDPFVRKHASSRKARLPQRAQQCSSLSRKLFGPTHNC